MLNSPCFSNLHFYCWLIEKPRKGMSIFSSLNLWLQFIQLHIYICSNVLWSPHFKLFCWMSMSDYSPITVSSSFPKINCWTFFIIQQECQMQICMDSICGSIWCLLMNQFNIPLNNLNLCQHRIGRHRDIAGMYGPMLALV